MNKVILYILPILCMAGIIIAPIIPEYVDKIIGFFCGMLFYNALTLTSGRINRNSKILNMLINKMCIVYFTDGQIYEGKIQRLQNTLSVRYQIGDRLFYKSNVARVEERIKRNTYRVYERQEVLKCR